MLVTRKSSHTFEVLASRSEWYMVYLRNGGYHIISYRGKALSANGPRAKQIKQALKEHLGGHNDY
jgi:hypothetical protein